MKLIEKGRKYKKGVQLDEDNPDTIKELFNICLENKIGFKIDSNGNIFIIDPKKENILYNWEKIKNTKWLLIQTNGDIRIETNDFIVKNFDKVTIENMQE